MKRRDAGFASVFAALVAIGGFALAACDDGGSKVPDGGVDQAIGDARADGAVCTPGPELCIGTDSDCDGLYDADDPDCAPGRVIWARRISGPGNEFINGFVSLDDGVVAVSGRFDGKLWVGSRAGAGGVELETPTSSIQKSFIALYNRAGEPIHVSVPAKGKGFGAYAYVNSAASDGAGGLLLVGIADSSGSGVILAEGTQQELTLDGAKGFVARFDAGGALTAGYEVVDPMLGPSVRDRSGGGFFIYDRQERKVYDAQGKLLETITLPESEGGNATDTALFVAADGATTIAGTMSKAMTFAKGTAQETTITPQGKQVYVARYAADGSLAWVYTASGSGSFGAACRGGGLLRDGSVLVLGTDIDKVSHKGGDLAAAGGYTLMRYAGDGSASVLPSLLAVPKNNNSWGLSYSSVIEHPSSDGLLIAGAYIGALHFGDKSSQELASSSSKTTNVFARHSTQGQLAWLTDTQVRGIDHRVRMAVDASGDVYVVGRYGETKAVLGDHELPAPSDDKTDLYLVRLRGGP